MSKPNYHSKTWILEGQNCFNLLLPLGDVYLSAPEPQLEKVLIIKTFRFILRKNSLQMQAMDEYGNLVFDDLISRTIGRKIWAEIKNSGFVLIEISIKTNICPN
jgi:hypothetical protein